jgi:SAM-dependent methyltransferase
VATDASKSIVCRFCSADEGGRYHTARDRLHGIPGEFTYLECGDCNALQLIDVPENLRDYYPESYYSFDETPQPTPRMIIQYKHYRAMGVTEQDSILDVGCGTGSFLLAMYRDGYRNLTGIDPLIPRDLDHGNGIRVYKRSIEEMTGPFDLVMLHHSFEHIVDQDAALAGLQRLVKDDHFLFIRTPVADSYAWHHYGVDWVQLDAPRHVNIHSEQSMAILAERHGFRLETVEYDSNNFQFWGSELYRAGKSFSVFEFQPNRDLPEELLNEYNKRSKALNRSRQGDQACFYLRKVAGS